MIYDRVGSDWQCQVIGHRSTGSTVVVSMDYSFVDKWTEISKYLIFESPDVDVFNKYLLDDNYKNIKRYMGAIFSDIKKNGATVAVEDVVVGESYEVLTRVDDYGNRFDMLYKNCVLKELETVDTTGDYE